jgi:hypothetical protein
MHALYRVCKIIHVFYLKVDKLGILLHATVHYAENFNMLFCGKLNLEELCFICCNFAAVLMTHMH